MRLIERDRYMFHDVPAITRCDLDDGSRSAGSPTSRMVPQKCNLRARPGTSIFDVLGTHDRTHPVTAYNRAALAGDRNSLQYKFDEYWYEFLSSRCATKIRQSVALPSR